MLSALCKGSACSLCNFSLKCAGLSFTCMLTGNQKLVLRENRFFCVWCLEGLQVGSACACKDALLDCSALHAKANHTLPMNCNWNMALGMVLTWVTDHQLHIRQHIRMYLRGVPKSLILPSGGWSCCSNVNAHNVSSLFTHHGQFPAADPSYSCGCFLALCDCILVPEACWP